MEIRPFTDGDLDAAAALLETRHARHRAVEPLLPADADYLAQVEREWLREGAGGAIAFDAGRPAAYLVGAPASNTNTGETRILCDLAGFAAEGDPEVVRDLFAAAAARWHDEGHRRFAVVVPAFDGAVLEAWFRLTFGIQFAYGVREAAPEPPVQAGVAIRASTPADLEDVARFDRLLWEHQAASPSFSGNELAREDFEDEWRDLWDEREQFPLHVVAERDGRVVGHALLYRRPTGDIRVPEANVDLAHAATDPDVRGSGAGLALTAHVLRWAHEQGFRSVTTDWRSSNLLSSRFWPRRGWRETHLRLYRAVP